jgi:hypothetical protein
MTPGECATDPGVKRLWGSRLNGTHTVYKRAVPEDSGNLKNCMESAYTAYPERMAGLHFQKANKALAALLTVFASDIRK